MTASGERKGSDLERLAESLRRYLLHRYRLLREEHDDLVQQTLADVVQRPGFAALGFDELSALSFAILKRRLADRFRSGARNLVDFVDPADLPERSDSGAFERDMHHRRLLRAVLVLVAQLEAAEQKLLLDEALPGSGDDARSDGDRQHLHRIRALLRKRLLDEYGIRLDAGA